MNKPSIQKITLRRIINLLILLAVIIVLVTGYNFRQLTKETIYNQAIVHAEIVKAGLTSHMKAGVVEKRDYFLEEIKQLDNIEMLEIIRGPAVLQQFGVGNRIEGIPYGESRSVFENRSAGTSTGKMSMPLFEILIPILLHS